MWQQQQQPQPQQQQQQPLTFRKEGNANFSLHVPLLLLSLLSTVCTCVTDLD